MGKSGSSVLPLHFGHPPPYLFKRMVTLGGILSNLIIEKFGTRNLIEKISDPFWFHSLSLAIGFDWNSSGTTTTTLGALKEYFLKNPGDVVVLGGKGMKMSGISEETEKLVSSGFISDQYARSLRSKAKSIARVDQNLLQDGFDLYMQFIVSDYSGKWSIVQQGMNGREQMARRYHWIYDRSSDLLNDSRNGLSADRIEPSVLDLTTRKSEGNRRSMVEIAGERPENLFNRFGYKGQRTLDNFSLDSRVLDLNVRVDWRKLRSIYEYLPENFEQLISIPGVGKSTLRAISYLAEIVYGDAPSYTDPVKFSFALGGKDGIPKPVNYQDYDRCIEFYNEVLGNLKHENRDLDLIARNLSKISFLKTGRVATTSTRNLI
ncbi:MAG: DUF763 domain-containing protein [Thermoplasmataceae archaeon]|jgi:hypothetical protein